MNRCMLYRGELFPNPYMMNLMQVFVISQAFCCTTCHQRVQDKSFFI